MLVHHLPSVRTDSPSPSPDLTPQDLSDPQSWWDWFLGVPLQIAVTVVIASIVLLALRVSVHRVTERIASGGQEATPPGSPLQRANPLATHRRAQRARTLGSVLGSTATIVVGTITLLMVLADLGANIAPLIASAGVVGVALGFGAQSLVKDFLSGTFMLLEDQYGVGDTVDFGTVRGTVEDVALRVTKVRDGSGTLWYLRNGDIVRVGNETQEFSVAVVPVVVDPAADLDAARAAVERAVDSVQEDPVLGAALLEPAVVVPGVALTADGITLQVRVRTRPAMQWDVQRAVRLAARDELAHADVKLVSA
ncbi:mechanosensitive ion channel family protein [Luteimicrobium subarcticum]|uniref:Small conductance mechanosensitive channel n=1 Tax=Luteimicrobium subarcticum TaxID=620910 RepID=A0A2M8WU74_9MICO|nr:mechanosensitive ion channel domain-containing protein [Luteimicrobium subarcticum]PJI94495.1 small conductance mechanosensitive channel [Luteimicrobium subarcticum]